MSARGGIIGKQVLTCQVRFWIALHLPTSFRRVDGIVAQHTDLTRCKARQQPRTDEPQLLHLVGQVRETRVQKVNPARPMRRRAVIRTGQRCLMKVPSCNSATACRSCSWVFITIGPYQATGSSIGLPDTNRNRIPPSPACTSISSPRSKSTSE